MPKDMIANTAKTHTIPLAYPTTNLQTILTGLGIDYSKSILI